MTLLNEVYEHPIDPAYEKAFERGQAGSTYGRDVVTQVLVGILALVIGLSVTVAVRILREPSQVQDQARELLVSEIEQRSAAQENLISRNSELTAEIGELSVQYLARTDPELAEQVKALSVASSLTPVVGDAFVVTLSDSADATLDPGNFPTELVHALDLQIVVNALWAGGAEAIAINGTRLGANESIRAAGPAILVDVVPVTSPYDVVAIGPVRQMQDALGSSAASTHLATLRERYHIAVESTTAQAVLLPAVRTSGLHFAVAIPAEEPTAGETENVSTTEAG